MKRVRSIDDLVTRARELAGAPRRRILGITGAPGAGKSALAAEIIAELDGLAVAVPVDGFHLTNAGSAWPTLNEIATIPLRRGMATGS
jgi:putative protein kinase ArgK-like GTPase of G3E family